jgi:hypothetical protein
MRNPETIVERMGRRARPAERYIVVTVLAVTLIAQTDAFARIRLSQESARPGDPVLVQLRDEQIRGEEPIRAMFGKDTPAAARLTPDGDIEVIVPMIPAGESSLSIYQGQNLLGRGTMEVRESATRLLTISYGPDGIAFLHESPGMGTPTGHVRSRQPRLSFDLINARGAVVYSGTILDPAETRAEVLTQASANGGPMQVGRGALETSGVIFVEVPTLPGPASLRVYRAAANLDLFTTEGRGQRRLIGTFEVRP